MSVVQRQIATMPDFTRVTRMFRHDVWSATAALSRLGVSLDEIVLEYAGGGWADGTVIYQTPPQGSALTPPVRIVLGIAGSGTTESLPYSLRRDSAPEEIAVDRVCALLDASIARTRVLIHEGGAHFRLAPDAPLSARRWIEDVMLASSNSWDEREWYRVARLFSALHRIAGRRDGIATALRFVYNLPVTGVDLIEGKLAIDASLGTRLGERNGRLGIDAVVGDGIVTATSMQIHIGPISIDDYLAHLSRVKSRYALYRLLVPVFLPGGAREVWVVEPSRDGYRLGLRDAPPLLGVSSYLDAAATETTVMTNRG